MAVSCALVETGGFVLRPTVVATVVEDGAVLLDLETKYFYHLNAGAWAITQLFETDGATAEQIEQQCCLWGAPANDGSVRQFLAELERENLVEAAPTAQASAGHKAQPWVAPEMKRQAQPLQTLVTSAFDPSIPLAE